MDKERPTVLVLLGSPRKHGNSAALARRIAEGAEEAGARVETVVLNDLKIAPCQACYKCQRPGAKGCAQDDDMQPLYHRLVASPAWVIASPVYWFNMSAQTKLWMDRCLALSAYGKDPFRGKKIAIAMSYGGEDAFSSGCINALRTFQDSFNYTGSKIVGMVYGTAMKPGEIEANSGLMEEARELGRVLVR